MREALLAIRGEKKKKIEREKKGRKIVRRIILIRPVGGGCRSVFRMGEGRGGGEVEFKESLNGRTCVSVFRVLL